MTPEVWTAVASVGTFIVIAATAIAAIVQLHHIRGSNQIVALNEFREAFESPEMVRARANLGMLAERLKDPAVRRELESPVLPDWYQHMQFPCRLMETLGGYVKHGIVNADIVIDLWGAPIARFWDAMAPAIVIMRRTRGDALYENFEMLAALIKQYIAAHAGKVSLYPKNLVRIAPPDRWAEEDKAAR